MFVGVKAMKKIMLYSKNTNGQQIAVGYIPCTYEGGKKNKGKNKYQSEDEDVVLEIHDQVEYQPIPPQNLKED